jgi:RND family efflux transporter MFP subunit
MKPSAKALAPFAMLAAGLLLAVVLLRTGPEPEQREPERIAPLVRVIEVTAQAERLAVRSQGTVQPRTESELVPEVSGPVVWMSPDFQSGGFIEESELLARVDPSDYHVALERAHAKHERAQSEWDRDRKELERRTKLAEKDYASPAQLDQASTQERVSRAAVRESKAALDQAKRDLGRTEIRAPYTGRVRKVDVDVGQFVNRGAPVATLYATDYAEIRLPIPDDDLAFLDLPLWHRDGAAVEGPVVTLRARFAGAAHEWQGRVVRTEGEIDPRTRMVHVVARVDDPYAANGSRPPLAVGLFVEAEIEGRVAENVIVVPRAAVRGGNVVFVVDPEQKLRFRPVEVLRSSHTEAVVRSGLTSGEHVVVSPLDTAVDGMDVRPLMEQAAQ